MGRYRITEPGIFGPDGEIEVGTVFELAEDPKGWHGRYIDLDAKVTSEHEGVNNAEPVVKTYSAVEGTNGWWVINDEAGTQVGKGIRKDVAEEFNAKDDAAKAEFVADHSKDA